MIEVTNASIQYPFPCAPSQGSVPVPAALEGTSVVPGGSASGAITTIPTFNPYEAAEPHYEGVLRVGLKFPLLFDLSYWLHNWRYVIPFPCVPCDGRLTYRVYFETGGLFGASALSASLSNWINVREIADVSAGIDFTTLPDYEVWPLNRNWPLIAGFAAEEIWAGVTLEGGFAVKRGKAPVLAIIVGVIVGLAGGRFTIFNADSIPGRCNSSRQAATQRIDTTNTTPRSTTDTSRLEAYSTPERQPIPWLEFRRRRPTVGRRTRRGPDPLPSAHGRAER
jgi:hypothetical protein